MIERVRGAMSEEFENGKGGRRLRMGHQWVTVVLIPVFATVGSAFAGWLALQTVSHGQALSAILEWTKNADRRFEQIEEKSEANRSSIEGVKRDLPDDIERRIRRAIDRAKEK